MTTPPLTRRPPGPQSGYALLLVFCMSAIIAIELYQQLPRAAFEAQREKESLLINHGQQYIRGVQLYVRKMGRYPAKLEDLDNTQNIRFLRKHYIDPMTGKDEWRLVHMGPAGKLIDSKVETADPNKDQWHQGSITEFKSAASSDGGGPEAVNLAARHRASDDNVLGPMGGNAPSGPPPDPNNPNLNPTPPPPGTHGNVNPSAPGYLTGAASLPGMPGGMRGITAPVPVSNVAPPGSSSSSNSSSGSGGGSISGNGGYGSSVSGNGGYGSPTPSPTPSAPTPGFGQPVNSQYQGQSPYSTAPGSNSTVGNSQSGFINPASYANSGFNNSNPALGGQSSPAQMINNLLTQPRPGGAPSGVGGGIGGSVVGGLAGVASTHNGHGIRRYNDQDEYQKWEFYYDFGADMKTAAGVPAAQNPQQQGQPGQAGQPGLPGMPGSQMPQTQPGQSSFGGSFGGVSSQPTVPTPNQ